MKKVILIFGCIILILVFLYLIIRHIRFREHPLFSREQRVSIPVVELFDQELVNGDGEQIEVGIAEIMIHTLEQFEEEAEFFGLDFNIDNIDFSKERIMLITNHRVQSFSYDKRNRVRSSYGFDILDIVLYPERTDRVHLYILPYGITTWEAVGRNRSATFAE